ncbi:MAG: proline--tRNA ligase [Candidatus Micrarchaeota archaeon]|nr:proline--tRNA ligase [Candidatus Micrarchaeota archaeon]
MSEKLGVKKKDFTEWFERVLFYSEIIDHRYPLKGVYVWRPFGMKLMKLLMDKMKKLMEKSGHEEAYFPLFSPISIFSKEAEFLKGFSGESLRVTRTGKRKLSEELVVRPTSETIMYYMFSLWIRSWRDLPLKIFQVVPIFRWETKMTKPLLRVREIVFFKEAHTAHETRQEADEQIKEAIKIYTEFFEWLGIPFILLKTPSWDTFAGAEYNYDFVTVLPDGKALELASVINLGQKFAKVFNIEFMDRNEEKRLVWQTCYGISERVLGAVVAIHGDDKGLVLPPDIAPVQVVVVPIPGKGVDEKIKKITSFLEGLRVVIDERDVRPGEKYYHWEAKGVPIRIEVGEKEVKKNFVTLARRDTGEKIKVEDSRIKKEIFRILSEIQKNISEKAKNGFAQFIKTAFSEEEAKKMIEKGGIVKIPWCGKDECGENLQEKLPGEALGFKDDEKPAEPCICGSESTTYLYFARCY